MWSFLVALTQNSGGSQERAAYGIQGQASEASQGLAGQPGLRGMPRSEREAGLRSKAPGRLVEPPYEDFTKMVPESCESS